MIFQEGLPIRKNPLTSPTLILYFRSPWIRPSVTSPAKESYHSVHFHCQKAATGCLNAFFYRRLINGSYKKTCVRMSLWVIVETVQLPTMLNWPKHSKRCAWPSFSNWKVYYVSNLGPQVKNGRVDYPSRSLWAAIVPTSHAPVFIFISQPFFLTCFRVNVFTIFISNPADYVDKINLSTK